LPADWEHVESWLEFKCDVNFDKATREQKKESKWPEIPVLDD
jgi:hypothetical protein